MNARPHHWPEALAAFIEDLRDAPFVWGQHDCCLFAANWVHVCHGVDVMEDFRGRYSSLKQAVKLFHRRKGGLPGIIDKTLLNYGIAPLTSVAYAQRGDLAAAGSGMPAMPLTMGICEGAWAWFPAEKGLARKPLAECVRAWRI